MKSAIFCLAVLGLSVAAAHADDQICQDQNACLFATSTVTTIYGPLAVTETPTKASEASSDKDQNKATYIAALRDDAAEYVAQPGIEAGAVLQNAIAQIRAKNASVSGLSDAQIAKGLLAETQ